TAQKGEPDVVWSALSALFDRQQYFASCNRAGPKRRTPGGGRQARRSAGLRATHRVSYGKAFANHASHHEKPRRCGGRGSGILNARIRSPRELRWKSSFFDV